MNRDCIFHTIPFLDDKCLLQSAYVVDTTWHFTVVSVLRIRLSRVCNHSKTTEVSITSYTLYFDIFHSKADIGRIDDDFSPYYDDMSIIILAFRSPKGEQDFTNYDDVVSQSYNYVDIEKASPCRIYCGSDRRLCSFIRIRIVVYNQKYNVAHIIFDSSQFPQNQIFPQGFISHDIIGINKSLHLHFKLFEENEPPADNFSLVASTSSSTHSHYQYQEYPHSVIEMEWFMSKTDPNRQGAIAFAPHGTTVLSRLMTFKLFLETIWDIIQWNYSYWWFYNVDTEN